MHKAVWASFQCAVETQEIGVCIHAVNDCLSVPKTEHFLQRWNGLWDRGVEVTLQALRMGIVTLVRGTEICEWAICDAVAVGVRRVGAGAVPTKARDWI